MAHTPEHLSIRAVERVGVALDAHVRVAQSDTLETATALREVLDEVGAASAELVVVFFADSHDPGVIATILDEVTGPRGVAGTTSGEIGPLGFSKGAMCAIAFGGGHVRAAVEIVPQLDRLSLVPLMHLPDTLARRINRTYADLDPARHLWLSLVDGLSGREALLTPFFAHVSPQLSLVGGSLADSQFHSVHVVHHGRVYQDAAAFMLLEYERPFATFHATHHRFSPQWATVTRASEDGLILEELDGRDAHVVFAEMLDVSVADVTMELTGHHPFGVRFRGRVFPVSILHPMRGGRFKMGSPVHEGERLNLLESGDLIERTREAIASVIERVGGTPRGGIFFHCLGRYIEAEQKGCIPELYEAMDQLPFVGLNTFGEQYGALHVNHSMTGVIFG